jgi:hypothetical protein
MIQQNPFLLTQVALISPYYPNLSTYYPFAEPNLLPKPT